jgi:hypothetical protein
VNTVRGGGVSANGYKCLRIKPVSYTVAFLVIFCKKNLFISSFVCELKGRSSAKRGFFFFEASLSLLPTVFSR